MIFEHEETAIKVFLNFIKTESNSSICLLLVTLISLIWANSPAKDLYFGCFHTPFTLAFCHLKGVMNGHQLINEGLMSLFFLLVTLEVKNEILEGDLNTPSKAALPIIAAVGGMAIPALIYFLFNYQHVDTLRGWAIPTATDIAFSLAILTALGRQVPNALKIFLAALAIFDDLGAILIIAIFYIQQLSIFYLILSALLFSALLLMNYLDVSRLLLYFLIGSILWVCLWKSGIHATLAGVLLGISIPISVKNGEAVVKKLQQKLSPWVAFVVLPLFALANTGIKFSDIYMSDFFQPITLGIFFGLFLGKQLGIFSASLLAVKLNVAKFPKSIHVTHLYGMSVLCGVGFTMSLFIGELAFSNNESLITLVKVGVLLASLISALMGAIYLFCVNCSRFSLKR